jgi:4-alpha-glucanotransferase
MPIGLIADLAVGVDPRGSECWLQPRNMLVGATIGAPPDALNAIGQNWGLTTFAPGALRREGFAPFLSILRASMQYAGGIRLDHVMSLMRLWLVPNGARAVDGAYVQYPFADLVRLVALESWRYRCIVIGEDLGTVPDDCRARLSKAGILGLDVLPFMRDGKTFLPPERWRAGAVAMTSTHDLAPLAGWWASRDLDWRHRLHLFGDLDEHAERAARDAARIQLARTAHVSARATSERIVDAAIDVVAQSPSPLVIVPVEDLVGAREQPNLPGTVAGHPNWRRRYRNDAKRLLDSRDAARRLKRLARIRKRTT